MSTKIDEIITSVEVAEGGDRITVDPSDKGGRTQYGISEKSNPDAWKDGVVTEKEARKIYFNKYVKGPKFDQILNPNLQAQLIDYGVNSGPAIAIQKVQTILGIHVDGILGPASLGAINTTTINLNNRLVGERIKMICGIVVKDPSQLKYLAGWVNRAIEFLG